MKALKRLGIAGHPFKRFIDLLLPVRAGTGRHRHAVAIAVQDSPQSLNAGFLCPKIIRRLNARQLQILVAPFPEQIGCLCQFDVNIA